MKTAELRELNKEELTQKIEGIKKELFELRMRRAEGKLTTPHRFIQLRQEMARILTLLRQKRTA